MTSAALSTQSAIFAIEGRAPIESASASDVLVDMPFADALVAASAQLENATLALARASIDQPTGTAAMPEVPEGGTGNPAAEADSRLIPWPPEGYERFSGEGHRVGLSSAEPEWTKTFELMVEQAGVKLSAQWLPAAHALRATELTEERPTPGDGVMADAITASATGAMSAGDRAFDPLLPAQMQGVMPGLSPTGNHGSLGVTSLPAAAPITTSENNPVFAPAAAVVQPAEALPAAQRIPVQDATIVGPVSRAPETGRRKSDPEAERPHLSSLPARQEWGHPNLNQGGVTSSVALQAPAEVNLTTVRPDALPYPSGQGVLDDPARHAGFPDRLRSGVSAPQQDVSAAAVPGAHEAPTSIESGLLSYRPAPAVQPDADPSRQAGSHFRPHPGGLAPTLEPGATTGAIRHAAADPSISVPTVNAGPAAGAGLSVPARPDFRLRPAEPSQQQGAAATPPGGGGIERIS